jgi:glycine/D-amino acid oxidase-like deaminating enzyme
MKTYDWIVIGNGIAGAALSYELAHQGASVLLLEQDATPDNATRYSYGGIAHWSAETLLMRQLSQEGLEHYQRLIEELDTPIQFREVNLLLTIAIDSDPERMAIRYAGCANPPILLTATQAAELEPLLNPQAISGALVARHGHVHPSLLLQSYNQTFRRLGGVIETATVTGFMRTGDRITGVKTSGEIIEAAHVVICAGGLSRSLLKTVGVSLPIYFTHAELIETGPVDIQLQTLIMPSEMRRLRLEAKASDPTLDEHWEKLEPEIVPHVLDAGVVQFLDGSLRIGQISRTLGDPHAEVDAAQSEAELRQGIRKVLPALESVKGTWHHCLVAFSGDRFPLVGPVPGLDGLHVFSGFSNPFAILPTLAHRFAASTYGQPDSVIEQLSPARFL